MLVHLAVDVRQGEVNLFVLGLERQQVFQPGDGLNVLSVARQNLGFPQLQRQAFREQPTCVAVHVLGLGDGTSLEVVLDQGLEVVVVKEARLTSGEHGLKRLGQRQDLVFFLVWTSFFVHSLPKYTANVGTKGSPTPRL